jgi:hypothetical protein
MNSRLLMGILFPLGFLAVSTFIEFLFELISENTLRRVYLDQIAIISGQCWRRLKIDHLEGFVPIEN